MTKPKRGLEELISSLNIDQPRPKRLRIREDAIALMNNQGYLQPGFRPFTNPVFAPTPIAPIEQISNTTLPIPLIPNQDPSLPLLLLQQQQQQQQQQHLQHQPEIPIHDFMNQVASESEDSGCEGDTEQVVISKKFDDIICGRYHGDHLDGFFREAMIKPREPGPENMVDSPSTCQAIVPYVSPLPPISTASSFVQRSLASSSDDSDDDDDIGLSLPPPRPVAPSSSAPPAAIGGMELD